MQSLCEDLGSFCRFVYHILEQGINHINNNNKRGCDDDGQTTGALCIALVLYSPPCLVIIIIMFLPLDYLARLGSSP